MKTIPCISKYSTRVFKTGGTVRDLESKGAPKDCHSSVSQTNEDWMIKW